MPLDPTLAPPAAGRRIGLFGGSFNPAHHGHLALSLEALKRLDLDAVWWLVSPQNPLKDPGETADLDRRIAAARAIAHHPRMVVTGIEAALATRTTAQTLRALRPLLARGRFVWLMGADSFAGLHLWNDWRDIPRSLPLAVFARPGWTLKALSSPAARWLAAARLPEQAAATLPGHAPPAWCFLAMPLRHESSTALRNRAGSPSSACHTPGQ